MSSLRGRVAVPGRLLTMAIVILGVLAMHGLAGADDPLAHRDAAPPGVTASDRGDHHLPGESHEGEMAHLGALCLWLVVTGVLCLHATRSPERSGRRPTRSASPFSPSGSERPPRRSRSPGLLPGVDLLRC